MNDKLVLRKQIKKRKPNFIRQDAHKKKRLGNKWRKPKGLQSKMRLGVAGYRKAVSQGYRSPVAVRGLSPTGFIIKRVNTISDLENIGENEAVLIANIGNRKRKDILVKALEKNITIINIKDPKAVIKQIDDSLASRKAKKTQRDTKKEKVKSKKEEKKEKEEKTQEDIKEEEKKKQDKELTKREM